MKPQSSLSGVVIIWVMMFGVLGSGLIASPLLGEEVGEGKNKAEQKATAMKEQALQKEIAQLIKQLGDDEYQKRDAAMQGLLKIGKPALEAVKRAMSSDDAEVAMRAKNIYVEVTRTWAKLKLDRTEFYLGELMPVHFVLDNMGKDTISVMNAYSHAIKRPAYFEVKVTDAQGKIVGIPVIRSSASAQCSDGGPLKPGEQRISTLMLGHFCLFEKPGKYTVSITYDQDVDGKKLPPATATITVKKPTDKQAHELLEKMLTLPEYQSVSTEDRFWEQGNNMLGEPMADFSVLRHPVYLPGLKKLAKTHPVRAIRGIGSIGSPDASLAILEAIAGTKNSKAIIEGLRQLNIRLDRHWYCYSDPTITYTNYKHAWSTKVSERAREVLPKLIATATLEQVVMIGNIFTKNKQPSDLVYLIELMNRAFEELEKCTNQNEAYSQVETLIDPMKQMIKKGGKWPDEPKTPGEIATMMVGVSINSKHRPKEWVAHYHQALIGKNVGLKLIAINTLPNDAPELLRQDLLKLIDIQTPKPVLSRVCDRAGRLKESRFRLSLLKVISNCEDVNSTGSAQRAALACGVTPDVLADIYVEKIDAENCTDVIKELCDLVTSHDWNGRSVSWNDDVKHKALKKRWRVFIDQHRERLKKEQYFKIGDKELTTDLLPRGMKFSKGDKSWSNWE